MFGSASGAFGAPPPPSNPFGAPAIQNPSPTVFGGSSGSSGFASGGRTTTAFGARGRGRAGRSSGFGAADGQDPTGRGRGGRSTTTFGGRDGGRGGRGGRSRPSYDSDFGADGIPHSQGAGRGRGRGRGSMAPISTRESFCICQCNPQPIVWDIGSKWI
ncbi:hypothetical protein PINS_up003170 [Pythium insidiosum]|nr:hypothetical protein PINS_up003170 [Pythium insidiosum]